MLQRDRRIKSPHSPGEMRLLVLPRYGRKGANSRYRLWQYIPLLESAGYAVDVEPMLDDSYLERLYADGGRNPVSLLAAYVRRIRNACRLQNYDTVIVDQELLPYFPPFFEEFAAKRGVQLVVDYDDAAYCKYLRIPWLRKKIARIMTSSRVVVVGNHHLEAYAKAFASDVRLIPTVVDVARYTPKQNYLADGAVRVCWIGTPITANRFLPAVLPVLIELQRRFPNLSFRFVGAGHLDGAEELRLEYLPWSEDTEASLLAECDIGIMPLQDQEFERGKCGLKLIQYMAAGLPVVASPVGENQHIVDHGVNGFHAADSEPWLEHLGRLIGDPALRQSMGLRGRRKVEEQYSLHRGFEEWARLLEDVRSAVKTGSVALELGKT